MLKYSVVLKFNNVEMLKSLWKLLKERPIKQGERWRQSLTERADSLTGFAGLIKKSACGRESNGAPILGKVTNYYKETKRLKKVLTCDIIKSQKRKEGKYHEKSLHARTKLYRTQFFRIHDGKKVQLRKAIQEG